MTAVSDLEVVQKETVGKMYYYKYPIEGEEGQFIHIATTRPETMFGDTAVAVSKENEKLKHLIGKNAILPIVNRPIPIVGDEHADPEKGTGAVKITPAHDFNDFEVGKRHNLPLINILNPDATLNENTPFPGMDSSSLSSSSPSMLTNPPMGSSRSAYCVSFLRVFQMTGPIPNANSLTLTPESLAVIKWPNS